MNHIICESEATINGTVQVWLNEQGTYDVATTGKGEEFQIRHPAGDAASAIRALGHYLHGEAYHRNKAVVQIAELKRLIGIVLTTDHDAGATIDSNDKTLMVCPGCHASTKIDDRDGIQHNARLHLDAKREATEILLKMIKD